MKMRIFFSAVFSLLFIASEAQTKTKTSKAMTRNNRSRQTATLASTSPVVRAESTQSYSAKATTYTIADPTINALNAKANGADVRISNSGIVGMPKRAYGFANGHLVLHTNTATSSGTITGSGAVGTGSSLGSLGTNGPAMELNGKSPYAGSAMWGNARNLWITRGDSAVRVNKTNY